MPIYRRRLWWQVSKPTVPIVVVTLQGEIIKWASETKFVRMPEVSLVGMSIALLVTYRLMRAMAAPGSEKDWSSNIGPRRMDDRTMITET
jgi:hypothetical protein